MQHLHRCFRKCLTHQSNALSGSVAPYISICLKLDIVRRQWYLVWRPHFKLGEERLRAKFIHVFFPWDYHTCIIWKELWGGQVCGHLPKGVVAEKPDWAAFFFVKAPAECQINKFLSEAETYAGNAPFWPQHWIPWFGVWVMSWSMNWPIWKTGKCLRSKRVLSLIIKF